MAQYVFSMNRVGKVVPPKREILKDISLSFFPGAKIGVLGLNGAGKSTLLRIMAGVDQDYIGEARPQPGINVDRKSTRLNSSHVRISYAVFCLKKKNTFFLWIVVGLVEGESHEIGCIVKYRASE